MRHVTVTIYKFKELSDSAKEKAREWYRRDFEFCSEHVIDDAANIAAQFGLDIGVRKPTVYWSGFCSQGDGASFTGTYKYIKGSLAAVKSYAPQDEAVHKIVQELQRIQRRNFYGVTARITSSGRYCHEMTMNIEVEGAKDEEDAEDLRDVLRDYARWIYRQLQQEYEYQIADAQVDDNIEANEYEFDEYGKCV